MNKTHFEILCDPTIRTLGYADFASLVEHFNFQTGAGCNFVIANFNHGNETLCNTLQHTLLCEMKNTSHHGRCGKSMRSDSMLM